MQLAFTEVLAEAEERRLDQHRSAVENFFDHLSGAQQHELATLLAKDQWETCASLCAAAGSWLHEQATGRAVKSAA